MPSQGSAKSRRPTPCLCGSRDSLEKPSTRRDLRGQSRAMRRRHKNHQRFEKRYSWKKPRIEEAFTEELVALLLPRLLSPELSGRLGSSRLERNGKMERTDASGHSRDKCHRVEIKATQKTGWQDLTEKDISSDCLIWIHFGDFYESDVERPIEIYVLANPTAAARSGDIVVDDFKKLPGVRAFEFDFTTWTVSEVTLASSLA